MRVKQLTLWNDTWNEDVLNLNFKAHILLLFMSTIFKEKKPLLNYLSKNYPESSILRCSTAVEISDISVHDNSVSLTAIQLEKATHKKISVPVKTMEKSYTAGLQLAEQLKSLIFAANIPKGSFVRLMKANIDRLINGAQQSTKITISNLKNDAQLAILISYVGRMLALKQLVEEEVEAVREILGEKPKITGFYSYGEIAPFEEFFPCELHNQTTTTTNLS